MHKVLSAVLLGLWVSAAAAAKDTLAILPFTGGQGEEGETIAELFSFEKELTEVFNPIPRTSINQAIREEQRFQMESGMTDPDTIKALGTQLGAQYVVAGSISTFGNQKLLIIAIFRIDELRQIAGDIQTYRTEEEIQDKLPGMARNIVAATQAKVSRLPALAVVPVKLSDGIDPRSADVLAQVLAIHLIRHGKYAVYPRTSSLEQIVQEYDHQMSGDTADEYLSVLGRGTNPDLVLSVNARKLGNRNMFNAAIINLVSGVQEAGESVNYQSLEEGMQIMEILALKLSDQERAAQKLEDGLKNDAAAAQKKAEAEQKWDAFKSSVADVFEEHHPYSYWSMGLSVGTSFATPGLILSPTITIPIVAVAYLDMGCDFGFFTNIDYIQDVSYNSYYPYLRASAFIPFSKYGSAAKSGFHIGLGYGCMIADYRFGDYDNRTVVSAFDVALGFLLINAIDITYSLRTDFKGINHKLSIGYVYRLGKIAWQRR